MPPRRATEQGDKKAKSGEEGSGVVTDGTPVAQGATPSKLPETQAIITQLFKEGTEDKSKGGSKVKTTARDKTDRNIESFHKSLEQKMDKMVTVDYFQKQFEKLITEEFLIAKVEQLKQTMRTYISKELDTIKESVNTSIKTLEDIVDAADTKAEDLEQRIKSLEDELDSVKETNRRLENKHIDHEEELNSLKYAMKTREIQHNDLEQYTRSNNIRIFGLDDRNKTETAEETTEIVLKFCSNKLNIDLRDRDIDIAHRLGKFQTDGNRPVICRFVTRSIKMLVMRNRRKLKGTQFVIKEDLTRKNQKLLLDVMEVENVKTAWSDQGKIIALLEDEDGDLAKDGPKQIVTLRTDLTRQIKAEKPGNRGRFKKS